MSGTGTSQELRQYGNEQYKLAGQASMLTTAADFLKKAVNAYEIAAKLAKDNEERCFALRNLGMAYWHLGKNCDKRARAAVKEKQADGSTYYYSTSHRTDYNPYVMLHFYKEAINAFRNCIPLVNYLQSMQSAQPIGGNGDSSKRKTPVEYLEQLNGNVNDCVQEAMFYLSNMDYFSTFKCRIEQLDHLINACGETFRDWSAVLHLEKAKTYHKWAVTEMDRSNNFATALHCLKECYSPMEIAKILMNTAAGWVGRYFEEMEELIHSVDANTAAAESIRSIQEGDKYLRASVMESEQLNVDGIHDAIDKYREAVVILHDWNGLDPVLEAEAFSKIGQVYYNVLKNEAQGKLFCMTAVQLAGSVEHINFVGKEWYDKAAAILKSIQDEARRKEEEEVRKNREPFLKSLEKPLKELEQLGSKSAETMIVELPKKFPPKHKADSKLIEELINMKFTKDTPRSDVKKLLSKLILLYHPDHVNIKEHGGEYFVLCEEITKEITKKYEFFK